MKSFSFYGSMSCTPTISTYFQKAFSMLFFLLNCTTALQPLNLSLICCVKVQYKKTLVCQLLAAIETKHSPKDKLKQITVLDVIHMLCSPWRNITYRCIKDCFKKAGILLSKENKCVNQEKRCTFIE